MARSVTHRGPDQEGFYVDDYISLGHERLKIIDLSENGRQPLQNEDGSIQVIFNGEIYNFMDIRKELERRGHKFYSDADTEVIVHAYEEFGKGCVKLFNGMFAFGLWDSNKRIFFLARDRLGIKPLYYYMKNGKFIFASEIKSILQDETVKRELNYKTLSYIIDFLFPLENETLFNNIYELEPGCLMIYDTTKEEFNYERYWDLSENVINKNEDFFEKRLEEFLKKSISRRLVSDVPLGATLSGGLDSSTIVALMSKVSKDSVKTFTVGFGTEEDEFHYAEKVAEYCGTEHKEIVIPFKNITKVLPKIIWNMETIISRTSTFPTYFYSEALKKDVTVTLIGEGGDEVFAGYPRYKVFSPSKIANKTLKNPYKYVPLSFFRERYKKRILATDVLKFSKKVDRGKKILKPYLNNANKSNMLNKVLLFEIKKQLPGVHLYRIDRMTMAHAVEARVPYLDHELVEFSMQMPSEIKLRGYNEKYILKKLASEYIPSEIIRREKLGLSTPITDWFEQDFFEFIPQILSSKNLSKREYLNPKGVQDLIKRNLFIKKMPSLMQKVSRKLSAKKVSDFLQDAHSSKLWFLCMIELWYRIFIEGDIKKPKKKIDYYI